MIIMMITITITITITIIVYRVDQCRSRVLTRKRSQEQVALGFAKWPSFSALCRSLIVFFLLLDQCMFWTAVVFWFPLSFLLMVNRP